MYNVLASGSTGNAIIYHGSILIDCGVPWSFVKPFMKDIQLVLLTHSHNDHINSQTLRKLAYERPTIRFGCGVWMKDFLEGIKNVDYYEAGQVYNYGSFSISPITLYHDVKNFGYRIFKDGTKIIHCTDTFTLSGITAKDYDLYCIESNYNADTVFEIIEKLESEGKFAHQRGAVNSHLSEQQCNDFFYSNKGINSKLVRLHETKTLL